MKTPKTVKSINHKILLVLRDTFNKCTAFLLLLFIFPVPLPLLYFLLFRTLLPLLLGRNAKLLAAECPNPRVLFKATSHLRMPNAVQISADSQTKIERRDKQLITHTMNQSQNAHLGATFQQHKQLYIHP